MTGRQAARSPEYAWLITTPLAVFALACALGFGFAHPDWYHAWRGGLIATVAIAIAGSAVLNVLIRRQNTHVTVTEIPLVLAIFFLPPTMVIIAATVGAIIARARGRQ